MKFISKTLNGITEIALQVAISVMNFVKASAWDDKLFQQLYKDEEDQILLVRIEMRQLSNCNTLVLQAELWNTVLFFFKT